MELELKGKGVTLAAVEPLLNLGKSASGQKELDPDWLRSLSRFPDYPRLSPSCFHRIMSLLLLYSCYNG
jgi:hypothetical protein